jgi:uncharacterized protein YbdZ (MbtH family)
MRKVKEMLHHDTAATTPVTTTSTFPQTGFVANPYAAQYNLPPNVASWQQGQPIPQGWRLGRKGYLKPVFVAPAHLSSWQQGQPIPEGYRLSKRGTLRPVNYFSWWSMHNTSGTQIYERTTVIEKDIYETKPQAQFAQYPASQFTTTAPVVEVKEKAPVLQEVIRPSLREEIQPVIHRDREQLEIREEVQPIYEKTVRPTVIEERQLNAEIREEVRLGSMPVIAEGPRASVFVEAEKREAFMHAPIVEEVVHKKIIEEVQPVIHREVLAPKIINERQDIYEKIVEAPTVTYTTLPPMVQEAPTVILAPAPPPPQLVEMVTTTTVTQQTEFVKGATGLEKGMQNLSTAPATTTTTTTTAPVEKKHHFNFLHRHPKNVEKH